MMGKVMEKERAIMPYSGSRVFIMSFITALLILLSSVHVEASPAALSVGLSLGDRKAVFSAPGGQISLKSASGGKASFRSSVSVEAASPGVIRAGSVMLKLPVSISGNTLLKWNDRPYRGYFRLAQQGGGFNVVNVLGVEDYLKGVLKMEVNPAWQMESLKAQAIIARTYALRNKNRHGSSGFDLCALSHCQVYRGVNAEDKILSKAVDLTKGIVLKYQGAYAATFYHADSGGHTADVSSVWGSSIPYLKGKPEPMNYSSPYSNWQTTMSLLEIQRILASKGLKLGSLTGLAVSSRDGAGRAVTLTLTGTEGRTTMKASQFRTMIGPDKIRSTFFSLGGKTPGTSSPKTPGGPSGSMDESSPPLTAKDEQLLIAFTQKGVFNTEELMDMLVKPERRGFYLRKALEKQSGVGALPQASSSPAAYFEGDKVTFSGRGWGHGVGLSQWGAKSLAEAGWDFKRILQHYFPGTQLSRVPE